MGLLLSMVAAVVVVILLPAVVLVGLFAAMVTVGGLLVWSFAWAGSARHRWKERRRIG